MKVAVVTDRISPFYFGGYEYLLYNLSQKLSERMEISIFTSMDEEVKMIGKVRYVKICRRLSYTNMKGNHGILDSLIFLFSVRKNVEKLNQYDVVIMNTIPYLGYGWVMSKMKARKISIFHEAWYAYLKEMNPIVQFVLRREIGEIVKESDSIVSVSSATTKSLISNYGARNVFTIPIGISTDAMDRVKAKREYDVVYIGRLARIKHVETLIIATKILVMSFPEIKVAIGGEGVERRRLEIMTRKLNLGSNIFFLGALTDEEKYRVLKSSRIFVLPSEREGFSV
ncbi:MAG: glycosyltransferase family 4 protein, partial [Candidatus Parvarchaeota archaeon]